MIRELEKGKFLEWIRFVTTGAGFQLLLPFGIGGVHMGVLVPPGPFVLAIIY